MLDASCAERAQQERSETLQTGGEFDVPHAASVVGEQGGRAGGSWAAPR
jgi:hypothetical protein